MLDSTPAMHALVRVCLVCVVIVDIFNWRLMDVINDLIRRVTEVDNNIDNIIISLVRENEKKVLSMNVNEQLWKGLNADGEAIRPLYAPSTVARKKRKRQPYNRVTTRDTGEFYESFFVDYDRDKFTIKMRDKKKIWLTRRYGDKLSGLTDQNIRVLGGMIKDPLIRVVKTKI